MVIERLFLYPPLAFARVGPSPTPCDAFTWGPNDLRPRGTGKTTVQPAETLRVAADGTVTSSVPDRVRFKDASGLRPVCPFFELHGSWELDGQRGEGPITPEVLATFDLSAADLRWEVRVGNLKAFHLTQVDGDRITASVEDLAGDDNDVHPLAGLSPTGAEQPLVRADARVLLGSVQLTRPTTEFPEFRLRFSPASGAVYGPTNLAARPDRYELPAERLVLNPDATWCRHRFAGSDPRTAPGGLFAGVQTGMSLGLVDDVCDGIVRCSLPGVAAAAARIVAGPPDYAPDRRPFTSLADGLADRVKRSEVADPGYLAEIDRTTAEMRDLFERVLETMGNINLDAQNNRVREPNGTSAFPRLESLSDRPLPLTELGRQQHRRFVALEVIEDMLREEPDLIDEWIRPPNSVEPRYDRRMPALIRGSDGRPMHLTRRQYDLLVAWAQRLRRDTEPGT